MAIEIFSQQKSRADTLAQTLLTQDIGFAAIAGGTAGAVMRFKSTENQTQRRRFLRILGAGLGGVTIGKVFGVMLNNSVINSTYSDN